MYGVNAKLFHSLLHLMVETASILINTDFILITACSTYRSLFIKTKERYEIKLEHFYK